MAPQNAVGFPLPQALTVAESLQARVSPGRTHASPYRSDIGVPGSDDRVQIGDEVWKGVVSRCPILGFR